MKIEDRIIGRVINQVLIQLHRYLQTHPDGGLNTMAKIELLLDKTNELQIASDDFIHNQLIGTHDQLMLKVKDIVVIGLRLLMDQARMMEHYNLTPKRGKGEKAV
jgi:hypothetical protein